MLVRNGTWLAYNDRTDVRVMAAEGRARNLSVVRTLITSMSASLFTAATFSLSSCFLPHVFLGTSLPACDVRIGLSWHWPWHYSNPSCHSSVRPSPACHSGNFSVPFLLLCISPINSCFITPSRSLPSCPAFELPNPWRLCSRDTLHDMDYTLAYPCHCLLSFPHPPFHLISPFFSLFCLSCFVFLFPLFPQLSPLSPLVPLFLIFSPCSVMVSTSISLSLLHESLLTSPPYNLVLLSV